MSLGNFYYDSTADLAGEDFAALPDDLAQTDFMSNFSEFYAIKITGKPVPGELALRQRTHDRIDAEKAHPSQNKRRHRGRQIHARGEAAGRDRAAIFRHRKQVGERGRADAVDAAGP